MPELLQNWLWRAFPKASQTTLRKMLETGRVRVNGTLARRMKQAISTNDVIHVCDRKNKTQQATTVARFLHPLTLIFEDEQILVVDKPARLLTSTVPNERRPTALAIVRAYLADSNARVGLIHRLDRDASGLLVFSKTDVAYRSLKQQFYDHTVRRIYTAITHGTPTPLVGRIESHLVELPDGTVRTSRRPGAGEFAVTEYKTITRAAGLAMLRVTLHTGRKHQIRVHLSERGVPIVGDRVYGKPDSAPRLMLVATTLGFAHPVSNKAMRFETRIPTEFPIVTQRALPSHEAAPD